MILAKNSFFCVIFKLIISNFYITQSTHAINIFAVFPREDHTHKTTKITYFNLRAFQLKVRTFLKKTKLLLQKAREKKALIKSIDDFIENRYLFYSVDSLELYVYFEWNQIEGKRDFVRVLRIHSKAKKYSAIGSTS